MFTTSGHIHSDQYPIKEELCAPCLSGDISRHDMESCSCVMEKSVDTCVQGKGVRLTWFSTCLASVNSSSMPSTTQTHQKLCRTECLTQIGLKIYTKTFMEAGVCHHSTRESEFQVTELSAMFNDSLDYIARSCLKKPRGSAMESHTIWSNPGYSWDRDQLDHGWRPSKYIVHQTLSWKHQTSNRDVKVAEVVECLPS
jgi:hypothetical protein